MSTPILEEPPAPSAELSKLARDVRATAALLERDEVRELVDLYYRMQEHRVAVGNQHAALVKAERPALLADHFHGQLYTLERQLISALTVWTDANGPASWAKAQVGIGPVLAAGVCAHIDIEKAPTAGSIWRFCGLDPTVVWGKGEKRPYNADAKVLCWKIGDSFVKVSGRDDAYYGHVYRERKRFEVERDERGENAETAASTLASKNIRDTATRKVYESGHLPAGRLDLRARRYAVKLFLSHLHHVMYVDRYDREPPMPYVIEQLGHGHYLAPPPPLVIPTT